jgi:Na+-driven multidrug efflux pump
MDAGAVGDGAGGRPALLIPVQGISETTCSLVSNVIGGGRDGEIREVARKGISLSYLATLPFAVFTFVFPEWSLALFTTEPATVEGCTGSLRLISLGLLIVVPAEILESGLTGTGDTNATFVIELVTAAAVIGWVYAAALALELPLAFAWSAEVMGALLSLGLSYGWLASGRWKRLRL